MPSQHATSDLGTRESLLTPAATQRHRSQSAASQSSVKSTSSSITTPEGQNLAEVERRYREESDMVKQAQAAVMDRPNFAIDAIGDSDGEEEDDEAEGADDAVMDEVEAFLKAHGDDDEGLKGKEKREAEGEFLTIRVRVEDVANLQICSRLIQSDRWNQQEIWEGGVEISDIPVFMIMMHFCCKGCGTLIVLVWYVGFSRQH